MRRYAPKTTKMALAVGYGDKARGGQVLQILKTAITGIAEGGWCEYVVSDWLTSSGVRRFSADHKKQAPWRAGMVAKIPSPRGWKYLVIS